MKPSAPAPTGHTPLYVSIIALATALIAALVSVVALARSGGEVQAAPVPLPTVATPTGLPSSPSAGEEPTTDPTEVTGEPTAEPTMEPTEEPTSEPTGAPDPTGVFTPVYQQEKLRLQPSCQRYVDLDEPRAGAGSEVSEFRYCGGSVRTQISFNSDLTVTEVKSPTVSPNDCAQELRRAPIDPTLTPTAKQNFCLVTSAGDATAQGIRRKIVLVTVDSITQDDVMNLTVTAWNVPR